MLNVHSVRAQCPDPLEVWASLEAIYTQPEDQWIHLHEQLQTKLSRCSYPRDTVYAVLLFRLGFLEANKQNFIRAIPLIEAATGILQKYPKRREVIPRLAICYYYLGVFYDNTEKTGKALEVFRNAMLLNYGEYSARAGLASAVIYRKYGDYERAYITADGVFNAQQKHLSDDVRVMAIIEKAEACFFMADHQKASQVLAQINPYLTEQPLIEPYLPYYYLLKGKIEAKTSKLTEAVRDLRKSALLFEKDGNSDAYASFHSLGQLYLSNENNLDSSKYFFERAIAAAGNTYDKSNSICGLGLYFKKKKRFVDALLLYQGGFLAFPLELANASYHYNPKASAIRLLSFKEYIYSYIIDKADTWLDYAKHTHNDKNKLKNALQTYMLADTMVDYMRWEHSGNVTKLFWREKTRSMYEHAIETCYLLNDPAKAFHFFEKSRAVMLNDQLNELGAKQSLSAEDQSKEFALKQKVTDLQNKLAQAEGKEQVMAATRSQLFVAQQEQENFIRKLETSNAQYYAYKYNNAVPTLDAVKKNVLAENQTLVSYFVGDSAVYGLAIASGKTMFKKIDLKSYRASATHFQDLIGNREAQNRQFKNFLTTSHQLYQLLVKPFDISPDTRVVISPDGSFLPFEAFSSSPVKPDYLVHRYAFSYTYSAGFLAKSTNNRGNKLLSRTFLGMAPVGFSPLLSQATLPGSDQILKTIDQYFFISKTLTDNEASRSAFVKSASDYRIVQLFTHATADDSGTTPTLYFADSTLQVNELPTNSKSSTELLILSACQTGIGKNQRGEGVFSLARGFAGMGIPSTLTTLWSIENQSVYGLTLLFYQELVGEVPLDIALQRAQIKWLNTATASEKLPYAWAGIVLVGSTQAVDTGISRATGFVLIGALIVSIIFLLYYFRRRPSRI